MKDMAAYGRAMMRCKHARPNGKSALKRRSPMNESFVNGSGLEICPKINKDTAEYISFLEKVRLDVEAAFMVPFKIVCPKRTVKDEQ